MQTALSVAVDALAYGMVLFTISIGLSIMMGLMRVINLAHGAFAMIGGYLASYASSSFQIGYVGSILIGVCGTVLVAMPMERFLFRRVYSGSEALPQILLSIGVTFVVLGLVNFIFGPTLKTIPLPQLISGPIDLGFRVIPAHRLFVIVCGLLTALGLWLLIEKTNFGILLRASVDNSSMAAALGVRTERVYALTFALAAALGAFGGVIGAEVLPIEPYYALRYMVTFLVVVSVGGAGSIPGALFASLALGLADTTSKYFVPNFGEFFFYLTVIFIVVAFPNGLGAKRL